MSGAVALVLVATTALTAFPVRSAVAAPAKDEADTLFERGKAERRKGQLREALALYRAAWAKKRTHDIAANLGQVEALLGMHRDAAEHLYYCVSHYPPTAHQGARGPVSKGLQEARAKVVAIKLDVTPTEAKVWIDGAALGLAKNLEPVVFVEPGSHRIEAKAGINERLSRMREVVGAAGEELQVSLVARESEKPKAVPSPKGRATSSKPVGVQPPKQRPERGAPVGPLVLGGIGAAGFLTGVVLFVVGDGKASDARNALATLPWTAQPACPGAQACASAASSRDSAHTLQVAGDVLMGIGGAAVLGAAAWWVFGYTGLQESTGLLVAPSSQGAGVEWHGRF